MQRIETQADALSAIETYRGKRKLIFEELGEQHACDLLHKAFGGNAQAAADHMGSAKGVVSNRWLKYGLPAKGRDSARHPLYRRNQDVGSGSDAIKELPREGFAYKRFTDAPELDDLEAAYIARTSAPELPVVKKLVVPEGYDHALIVGIYDLHAGAANCDWQRFVDLCQWIADTPNAWWFGGGDTLNLSTRSGPGSVHDDALRLADAMQLVVKRLMPIRKRGLFLLSGNHDGRILRSEDVQWNPVEQVAQELDLAFPGMSCHAVYKVKQKGRKGKQVYTHKAHHGTGAAQTVGASYLRLEKLMQTTNANLVTMGHLHKEGSMRTFKQDVTTGSKPIGRKSQVGMLCPSFQQYRGYAEDKALQVGPLGVMAVELAAAEWKIRERG